MIKQVLVIFFITSLKSEISADQSTNYDKDDLKNRYPDYGTKWMYFPNGDGVPTVVYLEIQAEDTGFFPDAEEVKNSLSFYLYTRKLDVNGTHLQLHNDFSQSGFDPNKDTKLVTHGWLSSGFSDTCISIKDAYLATEDVNVIVLDWSPIAGNILYPIPMAHSKEVGGYYANFIDRLIEDGANPKNIHLVGHSLGAHVSGFAGRAVTKGKIKRITALDPALPGFIHGFNVDHLLPSDADFVDVIHTCGGVLGIFQNMGHADFYPNGGSPPQPGCFGVPEIIEACSHGRSWKYFAESITNKEGFLSHKCDSWASYVINKCDPVLVPMGNSVPSTANGSYFLQTEAKAPFRKSANESNKINK